MDFPKKYARQVLRVLDLIGIVPTRTVGAVVGLPGYVLDWIRFRREAKNSVSRFPFGVPYPCFEDRLHASGNASGHYFHQDLFVAGKIFHNRPERHVDVGSRVDGFVAHVASFREIEVLDIRENPARVRNVVFRQADCMSSDWVLDEYCDSASSLHAVEHFGLGRYGDPINPDGHLLALDNIRRMLKPGGKFYFSVPFGPQRIEFNAHRVFSLAYLLELLEPHFRIDSFSYVNDQGELFEDTPLDAESVAVNFSCVYGCAIFELTKKPGGPPDPQPSNPKPRL